MPLFVIQVGQRLPGISGLFIAGIFAASLATMSGNIAINLIFIFSNIIRGLNFLIGHLNTLSGTIYMDFVRPW